MCVISVREDETQMCPQIALGLRRGRREANTHGRQTEEWVGHSGTDNQMLREREREGGGGGAVVCG